MFAGGLLKHEWPKLLMPGASKKAGATCGLKQSYVSIKWYNLSKGLICHIQPLAMKMKKIHCLPPGIAEACDLVSSGQA